MNVFDEHITEFIDSMNLGEFYPPDHPYLPKLSERAATLTKDETFTLNKGEDIADLTALALYDKILFLGTFPQFGSLVEITRLG